MLDAAHVVLTRKTEPKTASVRERILQGAARAIGELGYANARVEDILHAAGLSRPTFYKTFDSKEAVFEELSARHHREIRERIIEASRAAQTPAERLGAAAEAFLRWRAELGPIGRVLDLEARTPGTPIAHHRHKTLRDMTRLAAENMQLAGRPDTDPVLYYALIAALESVADSLLLKAPVDEPTLQRALHNALRIMGATLGSADDPIPPLPPAPPPRARRPRRG